MQASVHPEAARRSGVLYLYRELWHLARGHRVVLLCALGMLLGAALLELVTPYLFGRAINALQVRGIGGLGEGGLWLAMVPAVSIAIWLLHGPGRFLERNVALAVRERMTTELIERLLSLPLSWHETHHSGATAHRIHQSTNAMYQFAQGQFIYLQTAVRLLGPVIALWVISAPIGGLAIAGFALISFSITRFDRKMMALAHAENDADRRYSATLVDALSNTTTLFALRQAQRISALLKRRLLQIFEPLARSIVLNEAKWCTMDITSRVLSCSLVAVFVWSSSRGLPSSGPGNALLLGSIYMVWEYAQRAGGVISAIASQFQSFARQQADYASADVIRNAPLAHFAQSPLQMRRGSWRELKVRDLCFQHARGRKDARALDHLNFTLARGKRYALIGASGSGKSTLLRVLAGLYESERVQLIRDDGLAMTAANEAAHFLRASSTLIPQDAEVLEGTLSENLELCESLEGPPDPSTYARALELARATDFIDATPAGLNSMIAERGANWSGGQRGRVALARGILAAQGSDLILLDEPTASLDPRTEAKVYDNLFETFKEACIISSIHRLHLLDRFDEVLLMHEGRLLDHGSPMALAARSMEFRQMLAAHERGEDIVTSDETLVARAV